MSSEPSKPETQDKAMDTGEPTTSVDVDGAARDEGQSNSSSGTQQPINHPADEMNQTSRAASTSNKPSSGSNWWPFGGPEQLSLLQRQNRDLESRVEHLAKALSLKEKAHREELAEKESELSELKRTLCMYDECSEVDIGNMIDGINTRIQSLARNLAVRWIKEASRASDGGEDKIIAGEAEAERLKGVIGVQLVNALHGASPGRTKFTAVFLQLAWQASIVAVVKTILSSFSAALASSAEDLPIENALRAVSDAVRGGEVQPAYGRWRLVTNHYLKKVLPNEEGAIQTYVSEALGFCRTASRLAMKSRCPDDESFGNAFGVQTKEIIEEAFKLLTAIQEKVVTRNYEPYILANGRTFRPERMTLDKQDTAYKQDHVVCTTGLGMLYSRKNSREVTSEPPPLILFAKPQVLTEGNLSDMIAD